MNQASECPLKTGDIIRIIQWQEHKPNTKTVVVKVLRVVLPTLILVQYVKVWATEKMQRGEGHISMQDIKKYETIAVDQFDMLWNMAEDR